MGSNPTDEVLMRRFVQHNDRNAFDHLVSRYWQPILRFSEQVLGNFHLAEDTAQETFIQVYLRRHSWDWSRPFTPWLFAIARHLCIDKARNSPSERMVPLDHVNRGSFVARGHEAGRDGTGDQQRLHALMQRLPVNEREVLILRCCENLSYAEIAEVVGAPVNSVRSWIHRGRLRMKDWMASERKP